ncbi:MAG: tetratricopeptide repeat protein [Candidatus Aureabacteria bacterium]|nr:tetratricopeptide repeat protein [Candidatus Auribacterota bacterium]
MKKIVIFLMLIIVSLFVFYDQLANWVEYVSVEYKDSLWAPVALYNLAGFSMAVFKYDIALSAYLKARRHFPLYDASDEALFRIANIYGKQKRWKDAYRVYNEFCKKYPGHDWVPRAKEKAEKIKGIYLK